ncbi:hypothetical protein EDB92DRAFT_1818226 [Lactarius akahatsu]|uniref:Uncharacterized protein n=1 Tax=Lactarius akahatsu TaxID=416441 RepID=A0AAD4Q5U7_9AGAM|nr:hypothetical protein EDB92DRAFT_1818226 [Lactarius akahatsu]
MLHSSPVAISSSNLHSIFAAALNAYEKKTKNNLLKHPLAAQLQSCTSSADILVLLRDKVEEHDQSKSGDERSLSWLNPTINVLYAFSMTLGEGVGLASVGVLQWSYSWIFNCGVGQAAKDVDATQEALVNLFNHIKYFFKHLESYTEVPPTDAMIDIIVKIMVEVLNVFAIATKEMKQEKYLKELVGKRDVEDALKRLDKLTQEEAQMAAAQILRLTHSAKHIIKGVNTKVDAVLSSMRARSLLKVLL